ncbi:MAG: N-acyl-D-amino-acid deacylase family protein [Acidimicrobiia bacterium]
MIDLVLEGATVVDGVGTPRYVANVGIDQGRIARITTDDLMAREVIAARGKVVCPGFIDIHTHYDAQLLWDPTASPSLLHGVTTVLGGNCGFSIAPLGPGDAAYVQQMMARVEGIPRESLLGGGEWDWRGFGEYLARLDGRVAVNAGFLAGHSTLRRAVMGESATSESATPEQVDAMVQLLHESLDSGALGFSSSLGEGHTDGANRPVPSRSATFEEFVALAGALRDHPGTTLEFIPTVGPIPRERMELMADMSLAADRALNWNLLGSLAGTEIYDEQLVASDVASARGAHVVALTLPDMMRMRASTLVESLPGWREVVGLDPAGRRAAVADPATRRRLRAGAERGIEKALGVLSDWNLMEIAATGESSGEPWVGRSLTDVAAARGTDVVDVLIDVVLPDRLALNVVLPSLTPSLGRSDAGWARRVEVWKDARVVLGGSDAGAHVDLMCHANYPTVVLGEVVRDRGLLSLEEAVQMMTEVPARLYGLRDRGRVTEGCVADLVVFDPTKIASESVNVRHDLPGGGERLYAGARGVDRVLVAGVSVVVDGETTDATPGTVLRSGVHTETVTLAMARGS